MKTALAIIFYLCGIIGMARLLIDVNVDISAPPFAAACLCWPWAIIALGIWTALNTIYCFLFGGRVL